MANKLQMDQETLIVKFENALFSNLKNKLENNLKISFVEYVPEMVRQGLGVKVPISIIESDDFSNDLNTCSQQVVDGIEKEFYGDSISQFKVEHDIEDENVMYRILFYAFVA